MFPDDVDPKRLPSLKRRLLSGGGWAFGGRMVIALTGLGTNALLARLLSPQDLGTYFLAFSVVSFGAAVGMLGLKEAAVRFVAESVGLSQYERARRAITIVLRLGSLGAVGVGATYLLLGDVVGRSLFHSPALAAVTGLVAGWMVTVVLQGLLVEIFRGFHDIRYATLFGGLATGGGLVTGVLLTSALFLLWSVAGQTTLATVMLLAIGSGSASSVLASWLLRRKVASLASRGTKGWIGTREVLKVAWPLLLANLTLFASTQADLLILGAFRPAEEVAIYGAAVRLVALVYMPLLIVDAVVLPLIAELHAQGRIRDLERMLRATATLAGFPTLLVVLGFIFLGGPVLSLVYGNYYYQGATVLALLSLGQLVNVWTGSGAQALMMTGHQTTMMVISAFGGLILIAGALWAVRDYGAIGVASAAAASMMFQATLMLLFAKKRVGVWTHVGFSAALIREVLRGVKGAINGR
jgi:O-antigen/teichoic acid export membrane protein